MQKENTIRICSQFEKNVGSETFDLLNFIIFPSKDEDAFSVMSHYRFDDFCCLEKIEDFILRSNQVLDWMIFCFSSYYFEEVVFVTKHKFIDKLIEKNINDVNADADLGKDLFQISEVVSTNNDYQDITEKNWTTNISMSNYFVERSLGSSLSGIVFEKIHAPFDRLMECCNVNLDDILLVSDIVPHEGGVSYESMILPIHQHDPFTLKEIVVETELFLMKFNRTDHLKEICSRLTCSQADIMLIIPENTNLDSFRSLLLKAYEIVGYPFNGCDWMCLSEIRDTMEWFYGIERVYLHDECSVFISSNSEYIAAFDRLNINDSYKLIGCF
jgi:hypothetical protein